MLTRTVNVNWPLVVSTPDSTPLEASSVKPPGSAPAGDRGGLLPRGVPWRRAVRPTTAPARRDRAGERRARGFEAGSENPPHHA